MSEVFAVSDPVKRKIEFWRLERLLRQLNLSPRSIQPSERPDAILTTEAGIIGVEITTSTPEEYYRGKKLHYKVLRNAAVCVSELQDGPRRRSDAELIRAMTQPVFPPMSHAQLMQNWIAKVTGIIDTKRAKLNEASFQRFDKNWLLVDDEPGLPNDEFALNDGCALLLDYFAKSHAGAIDFDAIFIHSGDFFFRHENSELDYRPVYPLGESAK